MPSIKKKKIFLGWFWFGLGLVILVSKMGLEEVFDRLLGLKIEKTYLYKIFDMLFHIFSFFSDY
jgi:hypothetical protein